MPIVAARVLWITLGIRESYPQVGAQNWRICRADDTALSKLDQISPLI